MNKTEINKQYLSPLLEEGAGGRLLYEDNHIIAVNKSSSEIVQADKTWDQTLSRTTKAYIKEKNNKKQKIVPKIILSLEFATMIDNWLFKWNPQKTFVPVFTMMQRKNLWNTV